MTTLTTVGYGDISGENTAERCFCAVMQICGTFVFATIMNQLSMVLDNMSMDAREKEYRMTKYRLFLRKHFVDEALAKRIIDWAGFQYTNVMAVQDSEDMLGCLPPSMKVNLALALHERMLCSIPIFHRSGSEFIAEVALALKMVRYNASEKVASFGEVADKMYIVFLGGVSMTSNSGRHISNFTPGDSFGDVSAVRKQIQRTNITCRDFCELWCLNNHELEEIFLKFPSIKRKIHRLLYDSALDPGLTSNAHKIKHCVPFKRSLVASSNFRGLSMMCSDDGTWLPSRSLVEPEDDPVKILRWNFIVARRLRRVHFHDPCSRLKNALTSFGNKVWGYHLSDDSDDHPGSPSFSYSHAHGNYLNTHMPIIPHIDTRSLALQGESKRAQSLSLSVPHARLPAYSLAVAPLCAHARTHRGERKRQWVLIRGLLV